MISHLILPTIKRTNIQQYKKRFHFIWLCSRVLLLMKIALKFIETAANNQEKLYIEIVEKTYYIDILIYTLYIHLIEHWFVFYTRIEH